MFKRSSVSGKIPLTSDLDYGEIALNYADGILYYKTSVNTINQIGGASVTISDTPPSSPSAGNLWWDSLNATLRIYYTDADGSQWVDASSGIIGSINSGGGSSTVNPATSYLQNIFYS